MRHYCSTPPRYLLETHAIQSTRPWAQKYWNSGKHGMARNNAIAWSRGLDEPAPMGVAQKFHSSQGHAANVRTQWTPGIRIARPSQHSRVILLYTYVHSYIFRVASIRTSVSQAARRVLLRIPVADSRHHLEACLSLSWLLSWPSSTSLAARCAACIQTYAIIFCTLCVACCSAYKCMHTLDAVHNAFLSMFQSVRLAMC